MTADPSIPPAPLSPPDPAGSAAELLAAGGRAGSYPCSAGRQRAVKLVEALIQCLPGWLLAG